MAVECLTKAKPWPGGTAVPKGCWAQQSRKEARGHQRLKKGSRRTRRQQYPKQTRAIRHQLSIHRRYRTTTYGYRDADDEGEDGLHDERPQGAGVKWPWRAGPSDGLIVYRTRHFVPPSRKVPYAADRSLWRVKGSLGSLRVVQNPHTLTRCSGWYYMSGFPNYIERSRQDMVQ